MTGILLPRHRPRDAETDTQGEHHMTTEAETGVIVLPHIKKRQILPTTTRSWERLTEQILPQNPQKEPTLPTS